MPGKGFEKAYNLFLSESRSQVADALEVFTSSSTLGDEDCERLRSSFHKVKGGAGFFQLPEVSRLGAEIEAFLKHGSAPAKQNEDQIELKLRELEVLLLGLCSKETEP